MSEVVKDPAQDVKPADAILYNVTEATITKYETECLILDIKDDTDVDTYAVVYENFRNVSKDITGIEKTRVALKAPVLEKGKKIDNEAKRITTKLEKVKTYLKNQSDKWDQWEQDKKDKVAKELRDRNQARVARLIGAGMLLEFDKYVMKLEDDDDIEISTDNVEKFQDFEFEKVVFLAEAEFNYRQQKKKTEDDAKEKELAELREMKEKVGDVELPGANHPGRYVLQIHNEPIAYGVDVGSGESVTVETTIKDGEIISEKVVPSSTTPAKPTGNSGIYSWGGGGSGSGLGSASLTKVPEVLTEVVDIYERVWLLATNYKHDDFIKMLKAKYIVTEK